MSNQRCRLGVQSIMGYVVEKVVGDMRDEVVCRFEQLEGRELYSADGLVHHWNFDAGRDLHDDAGDSVTAATVAVDFVGGADGLLTNMDAGSDWVIGREFSALDFDGADDYLETGVNLGVTLGATSTLSFWIKITAVGGSNGLNSPGVMGVGAVGSTDDIQWGWIDNAGRINLSVGDSVAASSGEAVNDGEWHHIVMTRDAGSGVGQIYVDGVLSGEGVGNVGVIGAAFSSLGRIEDAGGSAEFFGGRLDEIHVFDRVVDGAMVLQLRDNHSPKTYGGDSNNITPAAGSNAAAFDTHSATMGFAYDYEGDVMTVASYGQPASGSVVPNGDGSFSYTANSGFVGNDSFRVVVTDGMGGFSETELSVTVVDGGAAGTSATTAFTDFQQLTAGPGGGIDMNGWAVPRSVDWDGDGKRDILLAGNNSVWLYKNNGTVTSPSFSSGVRVQASGVNISLSSTSLGMTLADMTGDGVDDLLVVDSNRRVRIYRNTAGAGNQPVYASSYYASAGRGSLTLNDQRFDVGDFNNDGLADIVTGSGSNGMWVYKNVGTAVNPVFGGGEQLFGGAYNMYPRLFDLNFDGKIDFMRGINWGEVTYWLNNGGEDVMDGASSSQLSVTDASGAAIDLHQATDGSIVDLGDYNGDGIPDLLLGATHNGKLYIAYGKNASSNLDAIETIYDANLSNLGAALSANDDALLGELNSLNREFINWAVTLASPTDKRAAFERLAAHINKYPQFLKHQQLDTNVYHHLPSIVAQNWKTLHQLGANNLSHMTEVADVMGLTGLHREIYLSKGVVVGDNAESSEGQLLSLKTFWDNQAGALFPDTMLTVDQFFGDGSGGNVVIFTSNKNVFGWEVGGGGSSEWAGDLAGAITSTLRDGTRADGFTYVVGHEVTHSLDNYVRTRANEDLERRWGQTLVMAGGPDIVAGSNGWYSQSLTQTHWESIGLYDSGTQSWNEAWDAYWETGPGSAWKDTSFMRGNIPWFYGATQESLATQANQHWADSEGRLIGAIDRYRRGIEGGVEAMKANINEVVLFIDMQSAGLNKVKMYDINTSSNPNRADWDITDAYLDRDDNGYITRITIEGRVYEFTIDAAGMVIGVVSSPDFVNNDFVSTGLNTSAVVDVVANDVNLLGEVVVGSVSQPSHGVAVLNTDGTVTYTPSVGYLGADQFSYVTVEGNVGLVNIDVNDGVPGVLMERWDNIAGNDIATMTGSNKYPATPDASSVLGSFESPSGAGDNYGLRMRAFLKVPTTGNYTFWVAADDTAELRLGTSVHVSSGVLIASQTQWAGARQWTKYASQKSVSISLVAGQEYYIEALMKEGGGGDNMAVAWAGPGISGPTVISGDYLRVYDGPVGDFNGDDVVDDADTVVVKNGFGGRFSLSHLFDVRNGIANTGGPGPRRVAMGSIAEPVGEASEPVVLEENFSVLLLPVEDEKVEATVAIGFELAEATIETEVVLGELVGELGGSEFERDTSDGVIDLFDLIGEEEELFLI